MGSMRNVRKVTSDELQELLILQAQRRARGGEEEDGGGGGLDNIDWTQYPLVEGSGDPRCKTDIKIVNSPELLCLYSELLLKAQLQEDRIASQSKSPSSSLSPSLVYFICADGGGIKVHQLILQATLASYAPPNSLIESLLKEGRNRCCHSSDSSDGIAISLMGVERAPLAAALSIISGGGAMIRGGNEMEAVREVFRMMELSRLWDKLVDDPDITTAVREVVRVQSFDKVLNPNPGEDDDDDDFPPLIPPPNVNFPRPGPSTGILGPMSYADAAAAVPVPNYCLQQQQSGRVSGTSSTTAPSSVETPPGGDTEETDESGGGEPESPETETPAGQLEDEDSSRNEVEENEEEEGGGGGGVGVPGSGLLPPLILKVPPGMQINRQLRPRINRVNGPGIKTARKRKSNKTGWPTTRSRKTKGRARASPPSTTTTTSTPPPPPPVSGGDDDNSPDDERDELGEEVGVERREEEEMAVNGNGGDEEDALEPPPPDDPVQPDPIPPPTSNNVITTAEEDKEETRTSCKSPPPPQALENGSVSDNTIDDGQLPGPSSRLHAIPNPTNVTETETSNSNSTSPTVVAVLAASSKEPEVIILISSSDDEEDIVLQPEVQALLLNGGFSYRAESRQNGGLVEADDDDDDDDWASMPVLRPAVTPRRSPSPTSDTSASASRKRGRECISPGSRGTGGGGIPEKRPSPKDKKEVPSFKCVLCPKVFTTPTELRSHLRICSSSSSSSPSDTDLESTSTSIVEHGPPPPPPGASEVSSVATTQISTSSSSSSTQPEPTSNTRQQPTITPTPVPNDVPPATASTSIEPGPYPPPPSPSAPPPPPADWTSLRDQLPEGNTETERNNNNIIMEDQQDDDSFDVLHFPFQARVVAVRLEEDDNEDIRKIMEEVNKREERTEDSTTTTTSVGAGKRTASTAARPGPKCSKKRPRLDLDTDEQSGRSSGVGVEVVDVPVVPQPVPVATPPPPPPPPQNEEDHRQRPSLSDELIANAAKLRESLKRKLAPFEKTGVPWQIALSSSSASAAVAEGESGNNESPSASNAKQSESGISGVGVQDELLEQAGRQPRRGSAQMDHVDVVVDPIISQPGTGESGGGDRDQDQRANNDGDIDDDSLLQQEESNHDEEIEGEEDLLSMSSGLPQQDDEVGSEPSEPARTVDPPEPEAPFGVYPAESGGGGSSSRNDDDLEETGMEQHSLAISEREGRRDRVEAEEECEDEGGRRRGQERPRNWIGEAIEEDGVGFRDYEFAIRGMSRETDNFLIMPSPLHVMPSPLHETARTPAHRNDNSPPVEPDPIADLNQESLDPAPPSGPPPPPPHPHHNEINNNSQALVLVSRDVVPIPIQPIAASNPTPPPRYHHQYHHQQARNPVPPAYLTPGALRLNIPEGLTIFPLFRPILPRTTTTASIQGANNNNYTNAIPPIIPNPPPARMQFRPGPRPPPNVVVCGNQRPPGHHQQLLRPPSASTQEWRNPPRPPGVTPPPYRLLQRHPQPHFGIGPGQNNPRHNNLLYLHPRPGPAAPPGFQRAPLPMLMPPRCAPPSNSNNTVERGRNQNIRGQWGELPPRQPVGPAPDGSTLQRPPPPPAHLVNHHYRPGPRSILRHELTITPVAHDHAHRQRMMNGMGMMTMMNHNNNNNQQYVRPQLTTTGPAAPCPPPMQIRSGLPGLLPIPRPHPPPPPPPSFSVSVSPLDNNLPPPTQPSHQEEPPLDDQLRLPRVVEPRPANCPKCGLLFKHLDRHLPNCL